jgi:hypothetical protein
MASVKTAPASPKLTCLACAAPRTPKGGRVTAAGWHCSDCWRKNYIVRAYEIPVAAPFGFRARPRDPWAVPTWDAFDAACEGAWWLSTDLANWAVAELAKADVSCRGGDEKIPPMPAKPMPGGRALYAHFGQCYPHRDRLDGAAIAASSLLRLVEAKYRKERYQSVWLRRSHFPCYTFPVPLPLHPQAWHVEHRPDWTPEAGPGGKYVFEVALPGGRWQLALRSNPGEFARQLAAVGMLLRGEAVACEAQLYDKPANGNDHRHAHTRRRPAGGRTDRFETVVKLVLWVPKSPPREACETMFLRTDPNAFWTAEIGGRHTRPWVLNGDHARRLVAATVADARRLGEVAGGEGHPGDALGADSIRFRVMRHRTYRQRMSEDLKYEKRWPAHVRRRMVEALGLRCEKQERRLLDWLHAAAALVANYCVRQGVCTVVYDDSVQSYMPSFPWFRLREVLRQRLEAERVELVAADEGRERQSG